MNKLHENQLLIASISNRNILEKTIHLEPEIFLNYNCQKIFDIIVRMYHENQSISITTMGLEIQNAYPELKQSFVAMIGEQSQPILEHEIDQIIEKMKDLYEKYVIDCLIVDYKKKNIIVDLFKQVLYIAIIFVSISILLACFDMLEKAEAHSPYAKAVKVRGNELFLLEKRYEI